MVSAGGLFENTNPEAKLHGNIQGRVEAPCGYVSTNSKWNGRACCALECATDYTGCLTEVGHVIFAIHRCAKSDDIYAVTGCDGARQVTAV